MYPKPVQDLAGWNIRSVGCANKSIVICADESVISYGPSPTFGNEFVFFDDKRLNLFIHLISLPLSL